MINYVKQCFLYKLQVSKNKNKDSFYEGDGLLISLINKYKQTNIIFWKTPYLEFYNNVPKIVAIVYIANSNIL